MFYELVYCFVWDYRFYKNKITINWIRSELYIIYVTADV